MLASPIVSGEHVSLAIKGLAQQQGIQAKGVMAPTWLASSVIIAARLLLSALEATTLDLVKCQALVASIVGFLFLSRASTICNILPSDFAVVNRSLLFRESYRKSKLVPVPRVLQFRLEPASPAWAIVVYCEVLKLRRSDLMGQSMVSLYAQVSPAARIEACLTTVAKLVEKDVGGVVPTSSHCLRRGGAVSMLAVGVPLTKICEWGHWAGEPSIRTYITGRAFQCPSPADRVCFEWLAGTNISVHDESPSTLV